MDARFMQMHNFVLTREIIINSIFPVDRMRELNFHREITVDLMLTFLCHSMLELLNLKYIPAVNPLVNNT